MAKDGWEEVRKGFDKWIKLVCYLGCVWIVLDILPHLPDAIGKRVADKLLGLVGL